VLNEASRAAIDKTGSLSPTSSGVVWRPKARHLRPRSARSEITLQEIAMAQGLEVTSGPAMHSTSPSCP
jgi:hypothetical protein